MLQVVFIIATLIITTNQEGKREATGKSKLGSVSAVDFLQLFHDVPLEVVGLKVGTCVHAIQFAEQFSIPVGSFIYCVHAGASGVGKSMDCSVTEEDYHRFLEWLQCYEKPTMSNLVDHNGRTIWFKVKSMYCTLTYMYLQSRVLLYMNVY